MNEDVEAHVLERYELIQRLGKGAYGIVWKAMDKKYRQVVALKKVFDAFRNSTDAQRTYREVIFLQDLNGHDNIIRLRNIIKAENNMDLYLVFEYMEADLHMVIRAGILEDVHKRYIIYQTLKALKYVHSAELIHRDLKPANILINSDVLIKVADFGLARSIAFTGDDGDYRLSEYIATRWYRAPEILMGSCRYTKAVDVWSIGCILGELMIGKPIFQGKSSLNQIEKVLELVGRPTAEDLEAIDSPHAETILNSLAAVKKKSFQQMFPEANEEALDLLRKMLTFNPNKRITIDEALKHKYVIQFSNPKEEILCPHIIEVPLNDFMKLSMKEYREAIYSQIAKKKRERRKKVQERSAVTLQPSDGSDKRTITPSTPKTGAVRAEHIESREKAQRTPETVTLHKKSNSSVVSTSHTINQSSHQSSQQSLHQHQQAYPQVYPQQPTQHQQPHHVSHSQSQQLQPMSQSAYQPQMKSEKRRSSLVPSNRQPQHTRSVTQSQLPSATGSPTHAVHSPVHNTNASPIYSRLQSSTMMSPTSGAKLRPYKAYEKSFSSQVKTSLANITHTSMLSGGDETTSHYKTLKEKDAKSPVASPMERKPTNPGSASKVRYVIVGKTESDVLESKEPVGKPISNSPQRVGQPGRKAYFIVDPAAKNMFRSTSTGMHASKVMSTTGNSFILKKK